MSSLYADIHKKIGNFSLDVRIESDAKRIGILGASGSGKSLTLRSIAGIEDIDSGHIEVNGRVLFDSDSRTNLKPQKRNVGYMFQNYALFPTMTVLKNVMTGLRGRTAENRDKAMEMLGRFRMDEYADRMPGELSGGQQQRVALARIMVTEPKLILLDEPFSALDGYLRDRMQVEMLEMLDDYPGQVVMVSHSRDELYRFSEELFVVQHGTIMRHGETRDVFRNPLNMEVARLTGCKNFSAAEVIDEHTLAALDWGVTLHLENKVPEWVRNIGYRAHYFEPVWGEKQENSIRFRLARIDELPFERNYYIKPEIIQEDNHSADYTTAADASRAHAHVEGNLICWFVQGEDQKLLDKKGLPDWLKMNEEHILLLR